MRSPFSTPARFSTLAKRETSRCNWPYVKVRCSPGSPSQVMAALLRRHVERCRSRQLYAALIFPPTNHSACGGSHFKTVSHFLNQCSSDSAMRAQKASDASDASRLSASNSSRDLTCACAANSGGGGKTRSSWSTDSMLVVAEDIPRETSPSNSLIADG